MNRQINNLKIKRQKQLKREKISVFLDFKTKACYNEASLYEIELDSYKFRRLSDAVIEHERPSQSLPRVWSAFQFRAVAGVKVDSLLDMLDGLFGLPFTPILGYFSVATTFFLYKKITGIFRRAGPR